MGIAIDRSTDNIWINGENTPDNGNYNWGNLYIYKKAGFYQSIDGRYEYDDANGEFKDNFTGEKVMFNFHGSMISYTDRNGNVTSCTYDAENRLTSVTDPAGNITRLEYDSNAHLRRIIDHQGRVTLFDINSDEDILNITLPDNSSVAFSYDGNHRLVSKTLQDGSTFNYIYDDSKGCVKSVEAPTGELREYEPFFSAAAIDARGNYTELNPAPTVSRDGLVSVKTDALSGKTYYGLDIRDRKLWETDPTGVTTFYDKDIKGNVLTEVAPSGLISKTTYNQYGLVVERSDNVRGVNEKHYSDGKSTFPIRRVDTPGGVTHLYYDSRGNITRRVSPDGAEWRYFYDSRGLLTSSTDPLGHITYYVYDGNGNLKSVTDPMGHMISYERDTAGNITSIEDPMSNKKTTPTMR